MIYRDFGKTGFQVSAVAYGGIVSMQDGQENSNRYVSWAIDQGINYFDVAPTYGDAQEKLGKSLKPYRKDIYLACKTKSRTYAEAEREFMESQKLLHTDYFDVYQMHELSSLEDVETAFSKDGIMRLMEKLKKEGAIRNIGITCHSEAAAVKAMSMFNFDTILFPLNWHMNLGHGFGNQVLKTAKEKDMGILAMKALIERAWKSKEEASESQFTKAWCKPIDAEDTKLRLAAIKYTLSLGPDILIPPGDFYNFSFVVEHIDECLNQPLNDEDLEFLKARYEAVKEYPFFSVG
jgi:Predicted oxidoreductases of the aldo/keto reductase family